MAKEDDGRDLRAEQSDILTEEMRLLRNDVADLKSVLETFHDVTGRFELNQDRLRNDLQLMFKTEFGAAAAYLKTAIDDSFSRTEEKIQSSFSRFEEKVRSTRR